MKILFLALLLLMVTTTTRADARPFLRKTSVTGDLEAEKKEPVKKDTKTTKNSNKDVDGVLGDLDEAEEKVKDTKTKKDSNGGVLGEMDEPEKDAPERADLDDPDKTTKTGDELKESKEAETTTTVRIRAKDESGEGGTAVFLLYVYDQRLADAPAYKVDTNSVTIPANGDVIITSLSFDKNDDLPGSGGKKWDDLVDPSMYVVFDDEPSTLDDEASTLTTTPDQERVVFQVQDGDTVSFSLQQKASSNIEVTVKLTEIHGMGGTVVLNLVAISETEGPDFKGSSLTAQSYNVEVPADGTEVETKLTFDSWSMNDWQQMSNPTMYLTIDEEQSDLKMTRKMSKTNQVSVTPGEVVELELKSVSTRVQFTLETDDVEDVGGNAVFAVYIYNDPIGEATATLAQTVEMDVQANAKPNSRHIGFDGTRVQQDGKTWFEMSNPAMYLTLIQEESDLRPADEQDEFIMDIQPGDQVTYELRQKKQSE